MIVIFGLYGLVVGSFAAVCIERLSNGESIRGRSHCPTCGQQLVWYELIPVVSYLVLGGRCRYCHAQIPLAYPLTEGLVAFLFAIAYSRFGLSGEAVIFCAVFAILTVISGIDRRILLIPDEWNGLLALCGLSLLWLDGQYHWQQALLGAVIAALPLQLIAWLTDGFGGGDVKMVAALGIVLGPQLVMLTLFIGCVSAAVVSVTLVALGKLGRRSPIPWGPFLALGAIIAILAGDELLAWYLRGWFYSV